MKTKREQDTNMASKNEMILKLKAKAWDDLVTFYNEHDFANSSSPAADLDDEIGELIDELDKALADH